MCDDYDQREANIASFLSYGERRNGRKNTFRKERISAQYRRFKTIFRPARHEITDRLSKALH